MDKKQERRAFQMNLEVRSDGDKPPKIVGYAAVFNSLSENLGGFREIIKPGAFKNAILKDDIRALWNHDPNYVLGRNKSGTLKLEEDDKGLRIEIEPPDTTFAKDLMESMRRGDVDQMSFGFVTKSDRWGMENGETIRELHEVDLFDVSIVTYPAYTATSANVRSVQEVFDEYAKSIQASGLANEEEKRKQEQVSILRKKLELKSKEI